MEWGMASTPEKLDYETREARWSLEWTINGPLCWLFQAKSLLSKVYWKAVVYLWKIVEAAFLRTREARFAFEASMET